MKDLLKDTMMNCGIKIMSYFGDDYFSLKKNGSPVTKADQESHAFLVKALKDVKNIPILSEEKVISYEVRKDWDEFWLVDPLDGTKEFISRNKDFCISIALIKQNSPIIGAIYAPALGEFYYAEKGAGFSYEGPYRSITQNKTNCVKVAISRFHHSEQTKQFLSKYALTNLTSIGSALKFCRLATCEIDLYPRFEEIKEWDIAAAHIILTESGGKLIDMVTEMEPFYNQPFPCVKSLLAFSCKAHTMAFVKELEKNLFLEKNYPFVNANSNEGLNAC